MNRNRNPLIAGRTKALAAGEELIGEPGLEVEMIENATPTEREMEALINFLAKVSLSLDLPLPFTWVMVGLPGTYTRLVSKQAERTFQDGRFGQKWLVRTAMEKQKNNALFSGILRGEIPWTKNWSRGTFQFPAHPSVDEGYDSDSDLNENRQGIMSMAEICGKRGRYWLDVDAELREEANNKITMAIELAEDISTRTGEEVNWKDVMPHIQLMTPNVAASAEGSSSGGNGNGSQKLHHKNGNRALY